MDDQDFNLFFDISQSLTSMAETLDRIADALERITSHEKEE